jgi:hypothetical protein
MDKKGDRMIKRTVLLLGLTAFVFAVSGCNTIYRGAAGAAEGVKSGAKQDWEDTQKTNAWMKKNLW